MANDVPTQGGPDLATPRAELDDANSPFARPAQYVAVSGLYLRSPGAPTPAPRRGAPVPGPSGSSSSRPLRLREEVRLDVDGRYPQMMASGVIRPPFAVETSWIARLTPAGTSSWSGSIWYKNGNLASFPYTDVLIRVTPVLPASHTLSVTFRGAGAVDVTRTFGFRSGSFHDVEFEFDVVEGAHPALSIDTHAHPNRPGNLVRETLSIATTYERVGFSVSMSGGENVIPLTGAGVDEVWSDTEMHDAMQASWSRYANRPAWSLWVLFAALHEQGTDLGGIMFDDIGPSHRQGTAIFTESFIKHAPAGDAAPDAWVARMRFWTAAHEMGHAFNLAHSWQKSHPPEYGAPWVPLSNDPEARSFMNYPYNVAGGQTAFFSDFDFRFSDQEILFMRHAPSRFVEMGNAEWFDDHAFENAAVSPEPSLALELRVNRKRPSFEFLEPVMVELKLTNVTSEPVLVDETALSDVQGLTMIIKRENQPARQWRPFSRACMKPRARVLAPGESMYDSVFVAVGTNGWSLSEPGRYVLQASLQRDGEDVVSNALGLRILPPRGYDEEQLAQDFFTDDVGRTLAFDGTRELGSANDVLREVSARLAGRMVAVHSEIAIGMPLRRSGKILDTTSQGRVVRQAPSDVGAARVALERALFAEPDAAAQSLGHIDYRSYAETLAAWLSAAGEVDDASATLSSAADALEERSVKPEVVADMRLKAHRPPKAKVPDGGAARAGGRAGGPDGRARQNR